jgi:glutamate 5-kinase
LSQERPSSVAPTGLIVVKLGSSSVTKDEGPDTSILANALEQSIEAMRRGWQVILVSSGAQSVGRAVLRSANENAVPARLAAAFGQPILMDFYQDQAKLHGAQVCQVLVGASDLRSQERMTAIADVLRDALRAGIIPIVNGNDPADDTKTNNDLVAAGIALMAQASHLLLLTDVPGVYETSPDAGEPLSELHVDRVHRIRSTGGGSGTGGIRSKLRAAEITARNGIETTIASSGDPHSITAVTSGEPHGTVFRAAHAEFGTSARKWVAGGAIAQGTLIINGEAERSIAAGSSLFASGIKTVKGHFSPGDVVELVSPHNKLLGRGRIRLSSDLLTLVRALQVEEIAVILLEVLAWRLEGCEGSFADHTARTARLERALRHLHSLGHEQRRRLLAEVIGLFPDATAAALVGVDLSSTPDRLIAHYADLVAGLRVIHNDYLVEFATAP